MNNEKEDRRNGDSRRREDKDASAAIQELRDKLLESHQTIRELKDRLQTAESVAPAAGDDDLRGLAHTYRTAVRNGHPDAPKHLEALLAALGA